MRAPALLAIALAACGPTKDGVAYAPLRPGPALVRYEQARGPLTIRIVAPESREAKVEAAFARAFEAVSAIDKPGLAADSAGAVLRAAGLDDFVVDYSGDAYFAGDAGGKPWTCDVGDPRGTRVASIAVRDEGVGAERGALASVTVLAAEATTAEASGTAALEAGPEAGLALVRGQKLEMVYVTAEPYVMTVTPGLKGRIEIEKDFTGEVRWAETK